MESSGESNCWVKGCKGGHDAFFHPRHNCLPPITPADFKRRTEKQGQEIHNVVRSRLPPFYTCECGKRWEQTLHGWVLYYDDRH